MSIAVNDDGINEDIENFIARLAFQGIVRSTIKLLPDQATIEIMDDDGKFTSLFPETKVTLYRKSLRGHNS